MYGEDITDASSNREGLGEMLNFLRRNRGMVVIIDDISRLARERDVYWALRKSIARTGATLACPSVKFGEGAVQSSKHPCRACPASAPEERGADQEPYAR